VRTSFGRMVKCRIPKVYLTNPSTEPSTPSRPLSFALDARRMSFISDLLVASAFSRSVAI
jgi:hypothetical protein